MPRARPVRYDRGYRPAVVKGNPVKYLLAIVLPPLAVLMCGKPAQALLNCLLTLCLWVPGIIHALAVVADHEAKVRNEQLIRAQYRAAQQAMPRRR